MAYSETHLLLSHSFVVHKSGENKFQLRSFSRVHRLKSRWQGYIPAWRLRGGLCFKALSGHGQNSVPCGSTLDWGPCFLTSCWRGIVFTFQRLPTFFIWWPLSSFSKPAIAGRILLLHWTSLISSSAWLSCLSPFLIRALVSTWDPSR